MTGNEKEETMAPKVRLTPTQLAVLRHATEGYARVWRSCAARDLYDSYDDGSTTPHVKVNRAVDKLADLDLLQIGVQDDGAVQAWDVTDLGREVLADYPEEG